MSKRKGINSRSKGKRGERQIANMFEDWWGGEFSSTPLSGGYGTKTMRDGMQIAGDIMTPDPDFPFCVEVKNAEGWHLEQLLTSPKCSFYSWWDQTLGETPEGLIPILLFKRNHHPWCVALDSHDHAQVPLLPGDWLILSGEGEDRKVHISLAENFLKTDKEVWRSVTPRKRVPEPDEARLARMQEVWENASQV